MAPQSGHVLGGTAVRVAGACLEPTDNITCIFHDTEVQGVYVNERVAICVSPHIQQLGRVSFRLVVRNEMGTIRTQGGANFFLRELIQCYYTYNYNGHGMQNPMPQLTIIQ